MKFSLVSLLALPLLAAAAPTEELELSSRAVTVTQAELDDMKYVRQLASAAYCNSKNVGQKVTCGSNACPQVTANNVVNIAHMDTDIGIKADGAVFVDHTTKAIVVSMMGSKSIQSFLVDLDFTDSEAERFCSGCRLQYGAMNTYQQIEQPLLRAIDSARAQYPSYRIVTTGHSSGGAVATIMAMMIRKTRNVNVDLYSFGSPRVGNSDFATFVTNQNRGRNYRITHYDDIVASLPPTWIGFAHVSPEYWLRRKDSSDLNYPLSEVEVCEGIKPSGCRNSKGTTLSTEAHSYYFGQLSACY